MKVDTGKARAEMGEIVGVSEAQVETIRRLIRNFLPKARIFAFGSRVTGGARKYSDLDLALDNRVRISTAELAAVKNAFSESDLPFLVDLVDLNAVDEEFRNLIFKSQRALF